MRVRVALQMLVILFGVGVAVAVYWNWRPAPAAASSGSGETAPSPDTDLPDVAVGVPGAADEREIVSLTENIYIVESRNGRDVFAIWAEEQVDYEDGWNTWVQVRVRIYGQEGAGDDIEIRSDRARTAGTGGSDFDEVVFIGNVLVTLPSGAYFATRRIDYDAVTGEVSNCSRNTLHTAGLEVRADCMRFQTAGDVTNASVVAEELRMWQDLVIRADDVDDSGGMPSDLIGRAEEMRFRPGGEFVRLDGEPQVTLDGVAIRGDEIVLDVGPNADELRGLIATGAARVRMGSAPVQGGRASANDMGDGGRAAGGQTLTGDQIEIVVAPEGRGVSIITATSAAGELARLTLGGFGHLDAGGLEVVPGDRLTARAWDEVVWTPRRGAGGLSGLVADSLQLTVAGDDLESLEADGGVSAALLAADGGERTFKGERLALGWENGEMSRGLWPKGISLDVDGRTLRAGRATFDALTRSWVLADSTDSGGSGDGLPRIRAAEFEFGATTMTLSPDGGLVATGLVNGTIGGAYLAAAAALFGDAEAVQLRAGTANVGIDGALRLLGKVEIVWQTQSLVANDILMEADPGRLRARGDVELVAVTGVEAEYVTATAQNLLVGEAASEVRLGGSAELWQGRRRISAATMVVFVDESGDWDRVTAETLVEFEEDRARGSGDELEYSMTTRDLRLIGTDSVPALFVYEGVDPPAEYRSNEELRVSYVGDGIVIESTEDGRATTSVVPRTIQQQ